MLAAALHALLALDVRASGALDACPSAADVTTALAARLPAGGEATAGWTLSLAPTAGGERAILVELADSRGTPRLERALPLGEASCRAVADAVALVVERYFSEIASGEEAGVRPPAPAAAGAAPAPGAATPGPPSSTPRLEATATPAPRLEATAAPAPRLEATAASAPPPRPRLEALAAAGVGHYREVGPRLALALQAVVVGPLELGLAAGIPATSSEPLAGIGTAKLTAWPVRLSAGASFALGPRFALGIAADALASFETGQTEGIPRVAEAGRTVLGLGAAIAGMRRLSRRLRVGVELAAHRDFGPAFVVLGADGASQRVLEVPSWDLLGSVRVGFALLP